MSFFYLPPIPSQEIAFYASDRERFERHVNPTFSGPANKNRSDLFTRVRVGAAITLSSEWKGQLEYQYAHDLYWTSNLNASGDNSDASLAFATYNSGKLTATGGRQRIDMSQMRLIGETDWLNQSRSFDAGRVSFGEWDAWYGKLGVAPSKPETARVGAVSHSDACWGTTSFITKHDVAALANVDIQTIDEVYAHKFRYVDFDGEGALQFGSNNERDQAAWAWHLRLAHSFGSKATVSAEANAASGGGTSSTSHTFDNLYPSNHGLYGLADLVGWKNMNDFALKAEYRPTERATVRAGAHEFTLRDPSDGWYGGTGTVNARPGGTFLDPTGKSGSNLGSELDLELIYSIKKGTAVQGGIALFTPGDFVKNLSKRDDSYTFGYVQVQTHF